jgi:hypothetical protein
VVLLLASCQKQAAGEEVVVKNGFRLQDPLVSIDFIFAGGPPRDGIPALNKPVFLSASKADYLDNEDRVLGVAIGGAARAYPVRILNWHEVVNDQFEGRDIVVTYCPLCGTGVAFDANIDGERLEFGVSGLLYNSDVLLYDRITESLWSQLLTRAISGSFQGRKLTMIPLVHTSWQDWQQRFQKTPVLSLKTGYRRDYSRNPYAGYASSFDTYFDVEHYAPAQYHPKEWVMGVEVDGVFKAYPFSELEEAGKKEFADTVNGKTLVINWDSINRSANVVTEEGEQMASISAFWFAWYAFHPDTQVFTVK